MSRKGDAPGIRRLLKEDADLCGDVKRSGRRENTLTYLKKGKGKVSLLGGEGFARDA